MRIAYVPAALLAALAFAASASAGTDDDPDAWPTWDSAKLGMHVKHPASAKISVHGGTVIIAGTGFAAVNIEVAATDLHNSGSVGGVSDGKVDLTVGVPLRAAHCTAASTDEDQLRIAHAICTSVTLDPKPRKPHVQLTVTSTGLADEAAFARAVHAKQRAVDACWTRALASDATMPEGSITLHRSYDKGAPVATDIRLEDFFDHDAKTLGTCAADALKGIAAKGAGDAAETTVRAICLYY
jgi:hypothetical protein